MRRHTGVSGFLAFVMILPSIVLTLWTVGYPVVDIAVTSIHSVNRFGRTTGFVGLANFAALLADPIFVASFWRTLIWTASVVAGTILVSLPIALVLQEDFAGRGLARVIIMLPWAISLTMNAVVWRWILNGQYGMLNALLFDLGLIDGPVEWLAQARPAFMIEIAIGIFVSMPFTVTILLGGLASLPSEIYEAARVDGASAIMRFRALTLPLLKPFINMAIVLNIIYVFNSFPIIWVLTQGDPANSTDILVTYLYKLAFRYGRLDLAAAMSIVMLLILLVFSVAYASMAMRSQSAE
ncbi:carbohydrate ABC transporter membrane protein 1, CUT1 family [Arboricoccus pini]|uniref:Carbohydrate ABC transporter membrane protein 1, CUT1 family n=1 Tax=Arboricoccus pini TaxID=1963835 RepID=A0A212R502_9PROT|nr:sugar ABC transporter permease [Arboricoccus pini]SNB67139.1 carbohydrate ABC transporter membrane protein 1, CUT1 family [Arboricoccus pini]